MDVVSHLKHMKNIESYTWIGAALLATQRVEFLTHGIVSHFKDIQSEKKFNKLTPKIFLNDTKENRKIRKQTLGQIFQVLKYESRLSITENLNDFLEKRNILVHELWRQYYKVNTDRSMEKEIIEFCKILIADSSKMERFYKGFLYAMAKNIAEKNMLEIPEEIRKMESEHIYFIESLQNENLT